METLHTWWATELYPMRERDQFGVSGEFEVALAADAQATIAALQAEVHGLKRDAGLDCGDHSCLYAVTKTGMRTNGGCRCNPKRLKEDLERSRKACDELQAQLAQRTAELEAAKQKAAEQGRYAVEMFDELKRVQAELERVRGELQSAEAGYFVAERDLQGANNKYDELRTLIAALPKVKGAVEVSAGDDGWYILPLWIRCVTKEQAEGYVALLQHRQGMEGSHE